MIKQTAKVLKAMGEPTRLTIMKFLSLQELCICELTAVLNMSQPRVSQHMKVLKDADLVTERRFKQKNYFRINPRVMDGFIIEPLRKLILVTPEDMLELAEEVKRLGALDRNREVQDCINDCREDLTPTRMVKIV
ncbi:MAG: winged helix-turn-helix transcriptional regulator [Syntrophomonadaceae bacterium]|nr:winged helix-turn-helix transcriptional regulator [Syntrophomonadaceae bacterium]